VFVVNLVAFGVHRRGLNPPHRVKSISMASFSVDEMDFIKCRGNDVCIYIDVLHDLKKLVFIICCYLVRLCFCTLTLVNASSERKTPQMRSHE